MINTFSRKAKRNEKMLLWRELTSKRITILSHKVELKMFKIIDKIMNYAEETIKNMRVVLTTEGNNLSEVKIPGGTIRVYALSPLLWRYSCPHQTQQWFRFKYSHRSVGRLSLWMTELISCLSTLCYLEPENRLISNHCNRSISRRTRL